MNELELEEAQQLAEQISADSIREGRSLGLALGRFSVRNTTPVGDLLADSTEIKETSHDHND